MAERLRALRALAGLAHHGVIARDVFLAANAQRVGIPAEVDAIAPAAQERLAARRDVAELDRVAEAR